MSYFGINERTSDLGFYGEPTTERPPLSITGGGLQLRLPPAETITGYQPGVAWLTGAQLARVNRVAEMIARSWGTSAPFASIRLTGYVASSESQPDLGQNRAVAVRDALITALGRLSPGTATRIRWMIEDRGLGDTAKVEIHLWAGPTAAPVPPLVRIPSPAEVARRIVPLRPETVEERIQRILRTAPPPPLPRRTFTQMFWQRLDDRLNSVMNRFGVPQSLRGPLRNGAHAAITRGSEALLKQILGASELPGNVQEAITGTIKGLLQVPLR